MGRGWLAVAALACGAVFWSQSARAQWPASVVGSWAGISNASPTSFSITSQTSGACGFIGGTTRGDGETDPIAGFYCPATGRIAFVRTFHGYQLFYSGNASTDSAAPRVTGRVAQLQGGTNSAPLNHWTFSMQKQ